ncbi:MAG: UbiX family flavin prenyltransferase [Deltaproteobacteria bacterium]|nr:UbiX family flavin prenyltransferase [Deltaproteobacteria bacterium]
MAAYIVAITGASGAVYGLRLIDALLKRGDDVELIISPSGFLILKEELGIVASASDAGCVCLQYLESAWLGKRTGALSAAPSDCLSASSASGSSVKSGMIVCPCSMGTLARIAGGCSTNLIERAADCFLKERRRLIVVPRETPLNAIHLENMLRLSRAGAVILPAMPAFYTMPKTVGDMVDFVVGKTLDCLGIENGLYKRWGKDTVNRDREP